MAARRPDERRPVLPYDGRLDLDALDAGDDLLDLDVIGEDRPTARETVTRWLEPTGVLPVLARHRAAVVAGAVVVTVAAASGSLWWVSRPAPLAPPHVFARAAGADPTAALVTDPTGAPAGVQQQVLVTSAEAPGVSLRLLGVVGPGLASDAAIPDVAVDLAHSDRPLTVGAAVSCATPEATTAALASTETDYGLDLQRTAATGEVRVDRIPLVGAATLVDVVHRACLQLAVDRDLSVTGLVATPVPGVAALDLDVTLDNSSPRSWTGVHVAAAARPVITNDGLDVPLEPGTSGHLHARLWPEDCTDPTASLREGLPLQADLGPDGRPPGEQQAVPSVRLSLPAAMVDSAARAAMEVCGTAPPRGEVAWARLREGGGNGSGGVIDLGLRLTSPSPMGIVEVDHLGDGSPTVGELFAYETPVHAVDGVATVKAQWRLPTCETLLRDGLPQLHVVLATGIRRPYLVPLRGEALRPVLFRLCGSEVSDLLG